MENQFQLKRCPKCKKTKLASLGFSKSKIRKDGLASWCKICLARNSRKWEKNNREKTRETHKKWGHDHFEQCKAKRKIWEMNNPDKVREKHKRWRLKNPDKLKINARRYLKTIHGSIDNRMSCGIRSVLRRNKSGYSWESFVDYTGDELRAHLESLFTVGMTWDAFMRGEIHIDHIVPKSRFHYESPEDPEFKVCWSLSNLQPMWASENHHKHAKTPEEWAEYKKGRL